MPVHDLVAAFTQPWTVRIPELVHTIERYQLVRHSLSLSMTFIHGFVLFSGSGCIAALLLFGKLHHKLSTGIQ